MTKIMFVDDEPAILDGLRRNLKRMDSEWDMHFVPSGREALSRLQGAQFDAIVTDVRMPEMDGVELLEEVSKKYPHMLRMVLTGHSDRRELLQSGTLAHQYLMKPTDADFLTQVIKTQLILGKLTRPRAAATMGTPSAGNPNAATMPISVSAPRGFDINEAIRHAVNRTRNEWEKIAQVTTELDPNAPRLSYLEAELPMVLLNFMVNAAHAVAEVVEKSGGQGKITVTTQKSGDGIEIRVADSGPGIPEHVRAKAFEWIAKEPLRSGPGAWLVLAHAILVEKHGGTITIDTVLGKGTTYVVRMPGTSKGR